MNRVLAGVLLIAVILALAIFLYYQMLDRKKFMATLHYMRKLDGPVCDWLETALSAREIEGLESGGNLQLLEEGTARYENVKRSRQEQKPAIVNEVWTILQEIVRDNPDHPELLQWKEQMNLLTEKFLSYVNEYNLLAEQFNGKLKTRTGTIVRDLLHLKELTVLEDLRL